MDEQSGFNLLQAAVLEGKYDIVLKANGLLENFLEEMEHRKTGNNAKGFPGKTAVDIFHLCWEQNQVLTVSKDFIKIGLRTTAD